MSFVVVVRGPLGAGKTTVARALAARLGARLLSVDPFVERGWDGGSERLFLRANPAIVARATPSLRRGRPVVLDGNFYWASALDDLLERLPYPRTVVTLAVPLAVCVARDARRRRPHGAEAAAAVYEKVARLRRGIRIDARPPVPDVVAAIEAHLPTAPRPRRSPSR